MVGVSIFIAGVGWSGFHATTVEHSFRELMWASAQRAFLDAGLDSPRSAVDSVVVCQEDYWEGVSISDEFAPDPLAGVLKPVFTVAGEGLSCIAQATLLLRTGVFETVLVESHGKPSDIAGMDVVEKYLMDPHLHRSLGVTPLVMAGLDAMAFSRRSGVGAGELAQLVEQLLREGARGPRWCRDQVMGAGEVLETPVVAEPLRRGMLAPPCDASVSVVLTRSPRIASGSRGGAVELLGVGWSMEASAGLVEVHEWGRWRSLGHAWRQALGEMGDRWRGWGREVFVEADDRYTYNLLQALGELGAVEWREMPRAVSESRVGPRGTEVVANPGGGLQSVGVPLEAAGLALFLDAVERVRRGGGVGVVASGRGFPSFSSTVAVVGGVGL